VNGGRHSTAWAARNSNSNSNTMIAAVNGVGEGGGCDGKNAPLVMRVMVC
jgi:hypothetical protein